MPKKKVEVEKEGNEPGFVGGFTVGEQAISEINVEFGRADLNEVVAKLNEVIRKING